MTQNGEPISTKQLSSRVTAYVRDAAIGKTGSCHLFRHTCATLMLEGGADVRSIQEMLGHEELSTTEIYTRVSIRRLKAVHALTHPSAKVERLGAKILSRDEHAAVDGQKAQQAVTSLLASLAVESEEEAAGGDG